MVRSLKSLCAAAALLAAALGLAWPVQAAEKRDFKIAWTPYAGWMPWAYAGEAGILKKWADKYGIRIELVRFNDYIASVNEYAAGNFDGVVATNMDTLTIPAAAGLDTTVLLIGDYSDGNDGVVLKKGRRLKDIKGQKVHLVELSVSHYLLVRALESVKLSEKDIRTVNTSDADMVAVAGRPDVTALVTWNPQLSEVLHQRGRTEVFDSSRIPGEIMDYTVVNTGTLQDNPQLGKALAGAWFETLALMRMQDAAGRAARAEMARLAGTDVAGFEAQLKTTHMFYDPKAAAAYARSPNLVQAMDRVRSFAYQHGLLGEDADSRDVIGIAFPGGGVLGDPGKVRMRFDDSFESLAAQGQL